MSLANALLAAILLDGSDNHSLGFSIDLVVGGGETRLVIRGEIDLIVRDELARALDDAVTPGGRVVLDVTDVSFLDSTGLGELARAAAGGCEIVVLNPQSAVRRALEVSGLDHIVHVAERGED